MIIDTHGHFGKVLNFDLKEETIIESMNKYHIDFLLLSSVMATEVDHEQKPFLKSELLSQVKANEFALELVKKYANKMGLLVWCMPRNYEADFELDSFISKNRKYIYGLKFHPFHSNVSFSSKKIDGYILLARKYNLPISIHTANDYESNTERVYEMAIKYPDVNFVCCHMGLCTSNIESINIISKLPNLYGDTAWVDKEKTKMAIKTCGKEHILFGTDMPIDGVDTYDKSYSDYLQYNIEITQDEYEHLMYKNAIKLFKINI